MRSMALRRSPQEKAKASTFHPPSIPRIGRTEAVSRCLLAIVLIAALALLGFVAACGRAGSAGAGVFEALLLVPLAVIVVRELRRALLALWIVGARGPRAISRFRRQLDALPETKHPLGA
jgi:hypothetical protein